MHYIHRGCIGGGSRGARRGGEIYPEDQMTRVLYILIAIFMLGFIVTVHEFGHYIVGRLCGIGIVEFSVGMGPKLFGFRRRDIDYSLRLIPLGGYCKFVGEDEENPSANAMNNQPAWKRLLTVAAGPVMNFLLAYVFCVILLSNFVIAEYQPRITQIYENTPAAQSVLQAGDIVTEINGTPVTYDQNGILTVREAIQSASEDQPVSMTVQRGEETIQVEIVPAQATDAQTGKLVNQSGIAYGGRYYRFGEAIARSCSYMVEVTGEMINGLKNLIFKGEGADEVMGPVGIISFVSDLVYNEKLLAVVNLIFILSLNIGIMNLLPLPALDGGRIVFLIIEMISGKPVPPEKEGLVHGIGFALLLILIVFITYKDIARLFVGG